MIESMNIKRGDSPTICENLISSIYELITKSNFAFADDILIIRKMIEDHYKQHETQVTLFKGESND